MSIVGAMFSAVSGLSANSNALGIISDNISNANTVGYKETSAQFETLITQSGVPSLYSPGGVQPASRTHVDKQGVLQASSSATDLAISGGGFFVVNTNPAGASGNGAYSFTRAGSFTIDANGNLKNAAGLFLQGQKLTDAQSQAVEDGDLAQLTATALSSLETVNVNNIGGSAGPTAKATIAANLPATDTPASPVRTFTVPVFDSQGIEHDMTLNFSRTATANQWQVAASIPNAGTTAVTITAGDDLVQFNADGTIDAAGSTFGTANALSIAWDPAVSGGTSPQTLTFNLGSDGKADGLTSFGNNFTVGRIDQNGVRFGNFTGVNVDQNGFVIANFDNGLHRAIYLVPIATFPNPDGLAQQSGNTFTQTARSGQFLLREAGTGAAGLITPSSLENSTVDIATEFSQLIITQRAYSANAKIITTADEMLQELIQTKR